MFVIVEAGMQQGDNPEHEQDDPKDQEDTFHARKCSTPREFGGEEIEGLAVNSHERMDAVVGAVSQTRAPLGHSQLPVSRWHEQIGDPTIADGILDRLVHSAHRIEMRGESMRKKRNPPQTRRRNEPKARRLVLYICSVSRRNIGD